MWLCYVQGNTLYHAWYISLTSWWNYVASMHNGTCTMQNRGLLLCQFICSLLHGWMCRAIASYRCFLNVTDIFLPRVLGAYGNMGCSGGNYVASWAYLMMNRGINTQWSYKYQSIVGFTSKTSFSLLTLHPHDTHTHAHTHTSHSQLTPSLYLAKLYISEQRSTTDWWPLTPMLYSNRCARKSGRERVLVGRSSPRRTQRFLATGGREGAREGRREGGREGARKEGGKEGV